MKLLAAAVPALLALLLVAGAGAAIRPTVQPGESWDAACEDAAPGDVIPLAAGSHPSQSVSCRQAAPGITFRPLDGADVLVGNPGDESNCVSLGGSTYVTVEGIRTTTYSVAGMPGQCGVAAGRGSAHHLTLREVDAGHIFIAADDVQVIGGDYGPTVDEVTLISPRTCGVSDGSCMPQRVLIDGALFHDYRRDTRHMECISFYGGDDVTIRNSRFFNCAVFSIFVSGGLRLHFDRLTFENNVYERGSEAMSNHVKFSNHGATYKNVVMRNERFVGDDLYVASVSASDYLFQGINGPINVFNACSICRLGTYVTGGTVVVVEGMDAPPPPASECSDGVNNDPAEDFLIDLADPGCSGPTDDSELGNPAPPNQPPTACFAMTPSPAVGDLVLFDASCSNDPDGDALAYAWDVAPAGDDVYERLGLTTTYAYTSAGTKTAKLRVDDGHGNVVIATRTLEVVAAPPPAECSDGVNNDPAEDLLVDMADPGCSEPSDNDEMGNPPPNLPPVACFSRTPAASVPGQPVVFDASCSSDVDGDTLSYTWDISPGGDGIYERSGLITSYAYASAGTKKARLRVEDAQGRVVSTEQTFVVVVP